MTWDSDHQKVFNRTTQLGILYISDNTVFLFACLFLCLLVGEVESHAALTGLELLWLRKTLNS